MNYAWWRVDRPKPRISEELRMHAKCTNTLKSKWMRSIATIQVSMASHHFNDSQRVNHKWENWTHAHACPIRSMAYSAHCTSMHRTHNEWHCFHAVAGFENTQTLADNLLCDAFPNKSQSLLSKLDIIARGKTTHIGMEQPANQLHFKLFRRNTGNYFDSSTLNVLMPTHTHIDVCVLILFLHMHFRREPEKPHHPFFTTHIIITLFTMKLKQCTDICIVYAVVHELGTHQQQMQKPKIIKIVFIAMFNR